MQKKWLIAAILIVCLLGICGLTVLIVASTYRYISASGVHLSLQIQDISAEADENRSFNVESPAVLIVENPNGQTTIIGGESQIAVQAHKTAWGPDKETAEQALSDFQVEMTQDGNTVRVTVKDSIQIGIGEFHPPSADLTIRVPAQTQVTVNSQSGSIDAQQVEEKVNLKTNFGDIHIENAKGEVTAQTQNGTLSAHQIQAGEKTIDLRSDFGGIVLTESDGGALEAHSKNGQIELNSVRLSGSANLSTDFGETTWSGGGCKSLTSQSQNGGLTFNGLSVSETLQATSDFGRVSVEDSRASSYVLQTRNGEISIVKANGKIKANSEFGEIRLEEVDASGLEIDTRSGGIEFSGSLGDGPHTLHTEFGNVNIRIPQNTAFDFDLETNFGKIDVQFDVNIQGQPNENHWKGSVNGGGAKLTVTTRNGNIAIETK